MIFPLFARVSSFAQGLVITGLFFVLLVGNANATLPVVSLEQARAALEQKSAVVIDIREPSEHATGVAEGAKLIPMGQIAKRLAELPKPADGPLYIICNTQNRSARIVEQLRAAGYTNASYVMGGMSAWASRGWPMVKPQ
jgi:rhodanese-related sulfurtransferase